MTGHPDLPYEQAKNSEYLEKLEKKLQRNPLAEIGWNNIWIDGVDHQIQANGFHHPLVGRVGCDTDDEDLRDFYIGPRFIQDGDITTYSWAAPIAKLFFQPDADDSASVVIRRTFSHRIHDIIDMDDDVVHEHETSPFSAKEISVPKPTSPATTRRIVQVRKAAEAISTPAPHGQVRESDPNEIKHGMRAPEAVIRRLEAPRTDRLQSVLALLQPDQHALVSWSPDENLVVQGHPGTGKTVVAAYRAAYLLNPAVYEEGGPLAARGGRPLRILLVGPTSGYVSHVSELLSSLAAADHLRVTHFTELLAETTGLKNPWHGNIGGTHSDVDATVRQLAEKAGGQFRRSNRFHTGPNARLKNIKAIYDLIAQNGTPNSQLSNDPDVIAWMRRLPPLEKALSRRYLPFIAQCSLVINGVSESEKFDHIIVDEAQDVSPIEWSILDEYLRRDGHWTLVGDMNQRRSDTTYGSWREIADHLALTADDDFEPQVMRRGYRSTTEILKFADRLLPTRQRGNTTLQNDGPPVIIQRFTKEDALYDGALDQAATFNSIYPDGSTAIITPNAQKLRGELGRKGWRRLGGNSPTWESDGRVLRLFTPEEARGLEFDAVVVVEPSDFPENVGRAGQLYTSLTRANRELAVVWHKKLPDALRHFSRK